MESGIAAFIEEQTDALRSMGIIIDYFLIKGKGIKGYLKYFPKLRKKIYEFTPDVIHAHYSLSGLLANIQRRIPVVTTYHGSDINEKSNLILSKVNIQLSAWNILVSAKMADRSRIKKKYSIIPCGVNSNLFYPRDKGICREIMGLDSDTKYALFSKQFDDAVKNYPLAKEAIEKLEGWKLIELIGYTHEQVAILMNACDVALMTSFSEGSPQFIKEALACGVPIVSTNVGDVEENIRGIENARICMFDANDVAKKIQQVVSVGKLNGCRDNKFDNTYIAKRLVDIYKRVIK